MTASKSLPAPEWAVPHARRAIHDNDVEGLKQLLAEYPALLSWRASESDARVEGDDNGLLGIATSAFGDAFDQNREETFTRAACAELLIDAGAVVSPAVCESLIESRARGLLGLFERKGLLPRTLRFLSALGDLDAVRASLGERAHDLATVNDAFLCACHLEHEAVASVLLERSIALDPGLGRHVDEGGGGAVFIRSLIDKRSHYSLRDTSAGPWQLFLEQQVMLALDEVDLPAFVGGLQRDPQLLGDACVAFQAGLIGRATLHDRAEFITALLDLDPALLRRQPPPPSQAIEFAVTYARTHLIPLLTRIWPMPDDLPHAAGMGDLSRVKHWFDESGAPALGDLEHHFPCNDARTRLMLQWGAPSGQQALDTALAWSVINRHFDVADFLLERGADINTTWSSHEPASILHELVGQVATGENPGGNYDSMQFLIDRGIDLTIRDYRWNSTARGWALYAAKDEKMAKWLEDAERGSRAAQITGIAPQLLVDDLDRAIAYYREKLGFELDFEYESFYASVSRDGFAIHLKHAPKIAADRANRKQNEHLDAYVSVSDARSLFTELQMRGAAVMRPLEEKPWACLEFYVEDPDGYILCFSQRLT